MSLFVQLNGLSEVADVLEAQHAPGITTITTDVLTPCLETIERAGGVLSRIDTCADGHKLLALFGAPRAGERDADWAVWAALRLREQLPAMNTLIMQRMSKVGIELPGRGIELTMGIGVNAGPVVTALVGSAKRYEYTVMGDAVNVAARLMGRADQSRHEILLGPGIYDQVRGTIDAVERGSATLKGKTEQIPIWEVNSIRPRSWRAPSSSPLIGRGAELAALKTVAVRLSEGHPSVVLLQGEAGVGKTRLCQALQDMLGETMTQVVINAPGRAVPAYGTLRALLWAVCAIPPGAGLDLARTQLRQMIMAYSISDDEAFLTSLEALVGIGVQPLVLASEDETSQHLAIAGLVLRLLVLVAARRPVALFLEDLHDFDRESLTVLEQLTLLGWDVPLLLCGTLRPGAGQLSAVQCVCRAALQRFGADVHQLDLGGLDADDGRMLLDSLIPGLAPSALRALLDHAGGNPLFLELLTQRIEQQGALRPDPHGQGLVLRMLLDRLAIPRTLRELVIAQLDALPPEVRRTARAAATLAAAGQTFTRWLLDQLIGEPSATAVRLDELLRAQVIVATPEAETFRFRHPLFQTEAYRLLQMYERRDLHRRAAEAIDTFMDLGDIRSELLAYHYRHGQIWDRTLLWSLDAGTRARRAYANDRAYAHLRRSLWLARRLNEEQTIKVARV
ncbi:MAG: AAA family ATPase, partial [Chloroflexi bacterium]|nr:AAA family ATPase [Chloroflexota bacterium]